VRFLLATHLRVLFKQCIDTPCPLGLQRILQPLGSPPLKPLRFFLDTGKGAVLVFGAII
jgi:hypothetical protein